MWGDREDQIGNVKFKTRGLQAKLEYPPDERGKILEITKECIAELFKKYGFGMLKKENIAELESGQMVEIRELGGMKIIVEERQMKIAAKNITSFEEFLTLVEQKL